MVFRYSADSQSAISLKIDIVNILFCKLWCFYYKISGMMSCDKRQQIISPACPKVSRPEAQERLKENTSQS